jgi:hypothetical protein
MSLRSGSTDAPASSKALGTSSRVCLQPVDFFACCNIPSQLQKSTACLLSAAQ